MNTLLAKVKEIVSVLTKAIPMCHPVSVGGSVRDAIMLSPDNILAGFEQNGKDFDLEIFQAFPADVVKALVDANIQIELVGRAFPVYKVKGWDIDISFPRNETKTGAGHADFNVDVNPWMSFAQASLRRDFTVNAIGYDWVKDKFEDPHDGIVDIKANRLHPVSTKFQEDALRVLRAFKFIARYGFIPSSTCIEWCQGMIRELSGYARERVQGEWNDFILKGKGEYIDQAFRFLNESQAMTLYPELSRLSTTPQSPIHHPEGNVYVHTILCLKHYMDIIRPILVEPDKLVVGYAVLAHDMGKPNCTLIEDGVVQHSRGHEDDPTPRVFLERLFDPADDRLAAMLKMVKAHMRPAHLWKTKASKSAIRRLMLAVDSKISNLAAVTACDCAGCKFKDTPNEIGDWMKQQCADLNITEGNKIEPLIKGRHLIEHLGMTPSAEFKPILDQMFEDQIEGVFDTIESGIELLKARYPKQ